MLIVVGLEYEISVLEETPPCRAALNHSSVDF